MEGFEIAYAKYLIKKYIVKEDNNNKKERVDCIMSKLFIRKSANLDSRETLLEDYKNIEKADKLYANDLKKYPNGQTEYGYPDVLRCKFIIYNRHRFERCLCKVSNKCDDGLYCSRHVDEDNIYEEEYENLLMDLESEIEDSDDDDEDT